MNALNKHDDARDSILTIWKLTINMTINMITRLIAREHYNTRDK